MKAWTNFPESCLDMNPLKGNIMFHKFLDVLFMRVKHISCSLQMKSTDFFHRLSAAPHVFISSSPAGSRQLNSGQTHSKTIEVDESLKAMTFSSLKPK